MRLFAFRGTRYHPSNGDPGRLAAPPFDQIDDELAARLRQEPHHFAHLTRPDPNAGDPHERATETQRRWLEEGILIEEKEPALYLYETHLATGGTRLGLCGLLGLHGSKVRPHERTVAKTVDERLDLLRKIRTDLEPIFLLTNDDGELDRELESDHEEARWLASWRDGFGHMHSIAKIDEEERIEEYKELLDGLTGLIADGHHRFKVASLYADEIGAESGTAPATKLVVLVSLGSPYLSIDPIHRAVRERPDLDAFRRYVVAEVPWSGQTGSGLALAVATARQPAVALWESSGDPVICTLDRERILQQADGPVPDLPVTLFHALSDEMGWSDEADSDGTIVYRSDPDKLFREMVKREFATSFWLPPMSAEGFSKALATVD
ncbi:MAG: DUF1015 domain-containing protein, partial [Thermoanaerobaculia bacterium]|nr:DUF1015 domain-containing protein [Thermoanaerobaculia bacterium]